MDVPYLLKHLNWKDNEVILDYGCGPGTQAMDHFLAVAKQHNSRLIGVDTSAGIVKVAKEKFPEYAENFYVGDILKDGGAAEGGWPLKDLKCDKIYCNHVIQLIQDLQ